MKPTYLELSAFASYRERACLDLARLGEKGLYLITGDTGAGKSTLFDAIAYALYGVASGDARGDTALLRNSAAAPEEETYVDLRFLHGEGEYRVRRNMEYRRPSRRGEKTALQKENAVLWNPDGSVVEGTRRVNAAVRELLGVGSEHFTRILMIAQGDFARLLLSDTKDREPILRSIFGTERFENFQKELTNRAGQAEKELEPLRLRLESRFESGLYPENHPLRAKLDALAAQPSAFRAEELADALAEALSCDEIALRDGAAQRDVARKQLETANSRLSEGKAVNAQLERLRENRTALAELLSRAERREELKQSIARAERAEKLAAPEQAARQARALEEESARQRADAEQSLARHRKECAEREQALAARETGRAGAEEARRRAAVLEQRLPAYDDLEALRAEANTGKAAREQAERAAQTAKTAFDALEARLTVLDERRKTTAEAPARREAAEAARREAETAATLAGKLLVRAKELEGERAKLVELLNQKRAADQNRDALRARYDDLNTAFFAAQAGILARDLLPGTPCPVCGSREHPAPARLSREVPEQAEVERAEQAARAAKEASDRASVRADALKGELVRRFDELKEEYCAVSAENLPEKPLVSDLRAGAEALLARREQEKEQARAQAKSWEALAREDADLARERDDLLKKRPALREESERLDKTREEAARKEASARDRARQLEAGLEFPDREGARREHLRLTKQYADWESARKAAQDALETSRQAVAADESLVSQGTETYARRREERLHRDEVLRLEIEAALFADEADYARARDSLKNLPLWRKEAEDYDRAVEYRRKLIAEQETALESAREADVPALEEACRAAQAELEKRTREDSLLDQRIAQTKERIASLRRDGARFLRLNRDCETVRALADTANGRARSNLGKITFERYILIDYFNRVLTQANLRFSRMSGGQYELVRAREAADLRSQTGLELNVADRFTGKERSVRSLSGGESFMASLSLALGFADVIRQSAGGVRVDAMFVDEGFGSLDSETLDQVMNVLTTLAGDEKLIGIISHVSDLRSRIEKRIVVEKTRSGSTARIEA